MPEPPPPATLVYLGYPSAKTISGFRVDPSTSLLTPLSGSPLTLAGRPVALAIDAQARFAYVGLRGAADALLTYAIDGRTGALTAVPCSGLAAPPITAELNRGRPNAGEHLTVSNILLHPSGRFAYVVFDYTFTEDICGVEAWLYAYAIDPGSGTLTRIDLPPQDLGRAGHGDAPPEGLSAVAATTGAYLYTATRGVARGGIEECSVDSDLKGYAVNLGTGGLRPLQDTPFASGTPNLGDGYRWVILAPAGDTLYLGRQQDTVRFRLKPSTGALKERGTTAPPVGPAAFSPQGRLYSAATLDTVPGVQVLETQPDPGNLIPRPDTFRATPGFVSAIAMDSSGRFLFALQSQTGFLSAFAVDATSGQMEPAPGGPTGVGAELSVYDPRPIAVANVP